MEWQKHICIIGGGASGMVAAIAAARSITAGTKQQYHKCQITLIDSNEKLGKKLYATGNGKCNFLNLDQDLKHFHGTDMDFIRQVISKLSVDQLLDFFKSIGIIPFCRNDYLYPRSEQAASLVEALEYELQRLQVQVVLHEKLRTLTLCDNMKKSGPNFQITTRNGRKITADCIILCTGGSAAPKTGSDGSGYYYAKLFGHSVTPPTPALCQLYLGLPQQLLAEKTSEKRSKEEFFKQWAGVRVRGSISIRSKEQHILGQDAGELLLTDYGISGIPVFQVSFLAAQALAKQQPLWAVLDFFSEHTERELSELLDSFRYLQPDKTVEQVMSGLLPRKLVQTLFSKEWLHMSFDTFWKQNKPMCIQHLKHFRLPITGTADFASAQVSTGGVQTDQICPETMESKLQEGLFFAGELLDFHGDCGGYNLQWAWTTGYLAGNGAVQRLQQAASGKTGENMI